MVDSTLLATRGGFSSLVVHLGPVGYFVRSHHSDGNLPVRRDLGFTCSFELASFFSTFVVPVVVPDDVRDLLPCPMVAFTLSRVVTLGEEMILPSPVTSRADREASRMYLFERR
jgi:hypothetical protein